MKPSDIYFKSGLYIETKYTWAAIYDILSCIVDCIYLGQEDAIALLRTKKLIFESLFEDECCVEYCYIEEVEESWENIGQ